jgi:tRNA (guanine37-N1)-methyltransferase
MLQKAQEKNLFSISYYNLRDFSKDKHKTVDDVTYGGGKGMVLKIEPLVAAIEAIKSQFADAHVIYFSPKGKKINYKLIEEHSQQKIENYIFVCGHYEGVDQRFIDHFVDEEISLGDFVMTGGEIAAVAFVDSLARHLSGFLSGEEASLRESFTLTDNNQTLLEYPQYTRPAEFRDLKVPEILLSGDHKKIEQWRIKEAKKTTLQRRPDL